MENFRQEGSGLYCLLLIPDVVMAMVSLGSNSANFQVFLFFRFPEPATLYLSELPAQANQCSLQRSESQFHAALTQFS